MTVANKRCLLLAGFDILLAIFLFIFFSFRLYLAAQGKAFWMDESDGLYYTRITSFGELWTGMQTGQANKSPLLFLVDKSWMALWDYTPQKFWDLRLFFRVPHVTAWAIANVYLFFHLRHAFYEILGKKNWRAWIFAIAITLFTYSNSFASYYAIETRAYSIWISLSLIHLLLFWNLLRAKRGSLTWAGFCLISALLVLNTYTAAPQIFFTVLILWLKEFGETKKSWPSDYLFKNCLILISITVPITLYYAAQVPYMDYHPPTWKIYWNSVTEVILKAFHHHSHHPGWITAPLILIALPIYWWKRDRASAWMAIHTTILVILSLIIFLLSKAKGGIFASRYVSYATPSLTFSYILAAYTLVQLLGTFFPSKKRAQWVSYAFIILSLSQLASRPWSFYKNISKDLAQFNTRNGYMENTDPHCATALPHAPEQLEKFNNYCRKLP
jgi:hypothetical protein